MQGILDERDPLIRTVNKELRSVKKWLDANKLSLNIDKTNYIVFHSPSVSIPFMLLSR